MLILLLEEFNNDNKAMSNIRIGEIARNISIIPIEIVMRDQTPLTINDSNFNIIINSLPTGGTHWVLVKRREGDPVYYFDSFGAETPPFFLKEYVDLGSNETIQQYDESYCGAYCLYMMYLIDRRFIIESALNILVNQVKCPDGYKKCFCLCCKIKGKVEVNDNVKVNVIDNVNVNGNGNVNDYDMVNDDENDNDNDNVNGKVNVNGFHPQRTADVKDNDNDNVNKNVNVSDNVNVNNNVNVNVNINDNDKQRTILLDDDDDDDDDDDSVDSDDIDEAMCSLFDFHFTFHCIFYQILI